VAANHSALTTGVDIVEISRIARVMAQFGERFLERVYTPAEVRLAAGRPAELAARFAAKEAVAKALGVGMKMLSATGIGWRDVEVLSRPSGQPTLTLRGQAKTLAEEQGWTEWAISLSHDGGIAIAFVVALGMNQEVHQKSATLSNSKSDADSRRFSQIKSKIGVHQR